MVHVTMVEDSIICQCSLCSRDGM